MPTDALTTILPFPVEYKEQTREVDWTDVWKIQCPSFLLVQKCCSIGVSFYKILDSCCFLLVKSKFVKNKQAIFVYVNWSYPTVVLQTVVRQDWFSTVEPRTPPPSPFMTATSYNRVSAVTFEWLESYSYRCTLLMNSCRNSIWLTISDAVVSL